MGRMPIHLSCLGGYEQFQEIFKAGVSRNIRDRDKMQRTVFHWAAPHRVPDTPKDLITTLVGRIGQSTEMWSLQRAAVNSNMDKGVLRLLDRGSTKEVAGIFRVASFRGNANCDACYWVSNSSSIPRTQLSPPPHAAVFPDNLFCFCC